MTMRTLKLTIAYDGTAFHGWQAQPATRTVQGVLTDVCTTLLGTECTLAAASRTDAGVHARGQVAALTTGCTWPAGNIRRAINSRLPADVVVVHAEDAPDTFSPRDAVAKHYRYELYLAEDDDPLTRHRHWWHPLPLEVERVRAAATLMIGTHDFRGLQVRSYKPYENTARTLFDMRVTARESTVVIDVLGASFMYKMVRSLVGLLSAVGRGRVRCEDILALLSGDPRQRRSEVAPPQGLTLMRVWFAPATPRLDD